MMAFARPVTIIPVVSQPGAEPYRVRAILKSRAIDFALQDGSMFSDQETTFDIRAAEVAVVPLTNDQIYVDAADWRGDQIDPGYYRISDSDLDRQGAVVLAIRKID